MLKKYSLILLLLCANAFADSDALDLFYANTNTLTSNFKQTVSDHSGKVIETSEGRLVIKRPGKFVLNYTHPEEQFYISDGKTLWIYDVELEQVTIKKADEKLLNSPALLISSKNNLRNSYFVKETVNYDSPEDDIFILTPKVIDDDSSMMFASIQLTFNKQKLIEIKMRDNFEQITRLKLYNQVVNEGIKNKEFSFTIPEHVDVIGTVN